MTGLTKLGRLEQVPLRSIWTSESFDFTPWLAQTDNIAILSETIGIELEVEAQEKKVGPFRADILCKDTTTGNWILVENQLEKTDHLHLGQLMTYAAGLKAVTIVWIAERFIEEHRATLDWLNQITDPSFNFFGLEIELWKIGDSAVAPKFNIVSKPNDWTRDFAASAGIIERESLSETKQLQVEFWLVFKAYVDENGDKINATKPLPQHWMNIALGRTGFKLAAIASMKDSDLAAYDSHDLRAEVNIETLTSKEDFATLENDKLIIEKEFGETLTWYSSEKVRTCRIYVKKSVDFHDRGRWQEYAEWLLVKLEALHKVFAQRIKQL